MVEECTYVPIRESLHTKILGAVIIHNQDKAHNVWRISE